MIVAVSMFRNEEDVARRVVEHLYAEGVDLVIVADNLSTDDTRGELVAAGAEVIDDPDPAYLQAKKMTALARLAADHGADWVLPFDADEVWYCPFATIGGTLDSCEADVLSARGWDHIARPDDPAGHPFDAIQWRRPDPQPLPKVAFRPHPDAKVAQGNHAVDRPGWLVSDLLFYRHFQYRSLEQMRAKVRNGAAAYDVTDLPASEGAHWRRLAVLTDDELEAEWLRLSSEPDLVHDPAPI